MDGSARATGNSGGVRAAHASTAKCADILRLIRNAVWAMILRRVRICSGAEFRMRRIFRLAAWLAFIAAAPALADDPSVAIALKNNQFVPSEVRIPAGVKVKLVVRNDNATASEFESTQFHREKVVTPGQEITVFVGPLDPGSYEFFDDFHPQTRGHLVVK
jgi:plastocyanin